MPSVRPGEDKRVRTFGCFPGEALQSPCTPNRQKAAVATSLVSLWSRPAVSHLEASDEVRSRILCFPSTQPPEVPGSLAAQKGRGRPGRGASLGKRICAQRAGGGGQGWRRGTLAPRWRDGARRLGDREREGGRIWAGLRARGVKPTGHCPLSLPRTSPPAPRSHAHEGRG